MNNLGDSGIKEIADLITGNTSLTHLDLSYNGTHYSPAISISSYHSIRMLSK